MKKFLTKHAFFGFFILMLVIGLLFRVIPVLNYNFPFTMDQGRDMLDIRDIVVGLNPTLVGPTTSINGVFLGPFWYYINVPPFILSGGDPAALVYAMIFWYIFASAALYFYFSKIEKKPLLALISSILFLTVPTSFYASRYSWNANLMPPFTVFYFLSLFTLLHKPSIKLSLLLGLLSGIGFQIEAAFGVLFLPFTLLVLIFKRITLKYILTTIVAFSITLIPQILFELRNNFVMTKTFLAEINGTGGILLNKLDFSQTVVAHFFSYLNNIGTLSGLPSLINIVLLSGSVIYLLLSLKTKWSKEHMSPALISLAFLIFSFSFYLFYHYELKAWYVLSLYVPLIFILGFLFQTLLSYKKKLVTVFGIIVFAIFVISSFYQQYQILPKHSNYVSNDPSNLRNLLTNIDMVYQKANGRGFKVYSYVPSVYDYSNQYLFWWYGTKKYGYQPDSISYLDNVPEYIRNNEEYLTKKKQADTNAPTFLIIESDKDFKNREEAWLGNFAKLCLVERQTQPWQAEIQLRELCDER